MVAAAGAKVLGPTGGRQGRLGGMGVRFMVSGEDSAGGFTLVEHLLGPRALAAPLHRHSREDEYSYVLEGRMGALLGKEVVYADAGDFVFKPRDQWHTFWNPGDGPCRILEIIAPGGFEHFFDELAAMMAQPDFDPVSLGELGARYGLDVDPEGTARVCAEHGLQFGAG